MKCDRLSSRVNLGSYFPYVIFNSEAGRFNVLEKHPDGFSRIAHRTTLLRNGDASLQPLKTGARSRRKCDDTESFYLQGPFLVGKDGVGRHRYCHWE